MKLNIKQQELINDILKEAKNKYPVIEFVDLSTNPDDPEHIWVNVEGDMEEEQMLEFFDFAAELDINILLDYGYKITLMLENPDLVYS